MASEPYNFPIRETYRSTALGSASSPPRARGSAPGWIVYDLTDNGVAAVIAGVVGFFGALLLIGALMDWRER